MQNSIEALNKTEGNKKIFICSKVDDNDNVVLTIKDNAGGIKTENIHKIFEPYFTTKHKSHGIGLGLNIVYKIIHDSMHGKIRAKNTRFTYEDESYEGAQFTITLPKKI